ncbi:phage holin family protein [Paenibacillus thiaminolyticus]|uniref:phage holin family protein n=1 Tax=Paenibacillus thiaminolyticus TaxID=49283 RepID=UPI0035A6E12F
MSHLKELGLTVWTAAAGANAKEATWGAGTAFIGTLGSLLGGWDQPLIFLLILMAADYITGLLGAIKTKTVTVRLCSGKACPSRILPRWSEFIKLVEKELEGMEKPKQQDYVGHWAEASIRRVMDARIMGP